jgi:hypothetical protein
MRRAVIIASILPLLLACDKPPEADAPRPRPLTEMGAASAVLFQVFGSRDEPRAAPVAVIINGALQPISLDVQGWARLDSTWFSPGRRLPIYRDGRDAGAVEVVRGMWPMDADPLYAIPGCRELVPHARLQLQATVPVEETVEFLASSVPLPQKARTTSVPRDPQSAARTIADAVASSRQVGAEELRSLEFIGRWLRTGAGPSGLTLLGSYIDPNAGDAGPGAGHTTMLLVLAEDSAGTLATSYSHVSGGEARTVEFQRVSSHADLDGDGVDEILLEQWRYAAIPELVVLKYADGAWTERVRVSLDWCVNRPTPPAPR